MKFKGFNHTVNTGSLDLQLVAGSRHNLMACVACAFTTPAMQYTDCGHVFCETCIIRFDFTEAKRKGGDLLTSCYCNICHKSSTCQEIKIQERFVEQLECICPACSTSMKIIALKPHLKQCFAETRARGKSCIDASRNASASSYAFSVDLGVHCATPDHIENDVFRAPSKVSTGGVTHVEDNNNHHVEETQLRISKAVGDLRADLMNKLATNEVDMMRLRGKLQNMQNHLDDLTRTVVMPTAHKLRFTDVRGTCLKFFSPHVTIAGCLMVYFVATSMRACDRYRDITMFINGVQQDVWKQFEDQLTAMKVYVAAVTETGTGHRVGPCTLEMLPRNSKDEVNTGLAYNFTNVFNVMPAHGSEFQVEIDYE